MRLFHRHKWEIVEKYLVNVCAEAKDPIEYKYIEIKGVKTVVK